MITRGSGPVHNYYTQKVTLHDDDPHEDDIIEETRKRRFKRAMALKDDLGLSDDERHELAQMVMGVDKDDGGSWKELAPKQLHDLITMMEGFIYIQFMMQQRLDTPD